MFLDVDLYNLDDFKYLDWNPDISLLLKNIIQSKKELISTDYLRIFKKYSKVENHFDSSFTLFNFLKNVKSDFYYENNQKDLFIIPSKYDFWFFLILAIGLKFYGKYSNLYFLYFNWFESVVNKIQQINDNFDLKIINFINLKKIQNITSNNFDYLNFSFFSKLNIQVKSIPKFSTALVDYNSDLDFASEFILKNSFDLAGFRENSIRRVLVHQDVLDLFLEKIYNKLNFYINLDSLINSRKNKLLLKKLYLDAISEGAEVLWGDTFENDNIDHNIILFNVNENMLIYKNKFYGPILSIISFNNNRHLQNLLPMQPSNGIVFFGDNNIEISHFYVLNHKLISNKYQDFNFFEIYPQLIYFFENIKDYISN